MKQEAIDSITSYGVGGTAFTIATLADIAGVAQAITVILACIVVAIRLIHDSVRLWRYLKGEK